MVNGRRKGTAIGRHTWRLALGWTLVGVVQMTNGCRDSPKPTTAGLLLVFRSDLHVPEELDRIRVCLHSLSEACTDCPTDTRAQTVKDLLLLGQAGDTGATSSSTAFSNAGAATVRKFEILGTLGIALGSSSARSSPMKFCVEGWQETQMRVEREAIAFVPTLYQDVLEITLAANSVVGSLVGSGGAAATSNSPAPGGSPANGGSGGSGGFTGTSGLSLGGKAITSAAAGAESTSTNLAPGGSPANGGSVGLAGGSSSVGSLGVAGGAGDSGCASPPGANAPILPLALPQACEHEVYAVGLSVDGRNASEFEWTAQIPEGLGLTLTRNELSGVLAKTGNHKISIGIREVATNRCWTATRAISVNGKQMQACPVIGVAGQSLPPPACGSWPYNATFTVSGGSPPYSWQALELPNGIVFDPVKGQALGTPSAPGPITLQITDSRGRSIRTTYEIPLRDKCWLGYITEQASQSLLHLVDPYLRNGFQRPSSDDITTSIVDFRFSPDGKFIAYRTQDPSGQQQLVLWQGPRWTGEHTLDLGGTSSVTHYAWSDNSTVLAVAYRAGDGSEMLGGVRVESVPDAPLASQIQYLVPIIAGVGSELTWYGIDGHVTFHRADVALPSRRSVWTASLDTNLAGFSALRRSDMATYDALVVVQPASTGFFVAEEDSPILDFYGLGWIGPVRHGNAAPAPSGAYTATAVENELNLFRDTDSSLGSHLSPFGVAPGCSRILAWAAQQERIACADNNSNPGTIRVFSLETPWALSSVSVANSTSFVTGPWPGHRRQMSSSGNWLALSTDQALSVVKLDSSTPQIVWTGPLPADSGATEFSFSPDTRLLAVKTAKSTSLFDLGSTEHIPLVLGILSVAAEPCQEDMLTNPLWCGHSSAMKYLDWFGDSRSVAYVLDPLDPLNTSDTPELVVRDLRDGAKEVIVVATSCGDHCAKWFRTQP